MSRKNQTKAISFFTAGTITVISITLVLFLLGLTVLVGFTANSLTSYLKENLGVTIELTDKVAPAAVAKMQKELDANPYLKSAVYISRDEAKKELIEMLGGDPEEVLGYDMSRSYFDVYIKSEYVNTESMKEVEKSLRGGTLIQNIVYSDDTISNANANLSIVGTVLFALTLILIAISFTLIRSIIQLNIYSKRFLINTMQLVGATNSFIRSPFVWRMVISGIVAAILANIAITGVVYYLTSIFPESISIIQQKELLIVFGAVLVSGILISALATISAVNRYLRMTTNKLYSV